MTLLRSPSDVTKWRLQTRPSRTYIELLESKRSGARGGGGQGGGKEKQEGAEPVDWPLFA